MALPYVVREGLANFRRAPFAAFAATSAMVVALVLIGVFVFLSLYLNAVSAYASERLGEVEVYLEPGVDSLSARALTARSATLTGVVDARFIPEAEARADFQRTFAESVEEGVLPASIRLRVKPEYAVADSLTRLAGRLSGYRGVDEVVYDRGLAGRVQGYLRLLHTAGLAIVLLVVGAALFLVANTIRLTVYARRLLIRTMKLVGATDGFIRQPFLVEGMVQGLIAGVVAALVLWAMLAGVQTWGLDLFTNRLYNTLPLVISLVLGLFIGWIGTYVALRRFIRNVALH